MSEGGGPARNEGRPGLPDAALKAFLARGAEAQKAIDLLQGENAPGARPSRRAFGAPQDEGRGANVGWRKRKVHKRQRSEHYVEEPWTSRRLIERLRLDKDMIVIVDPCAGVGNVIRSARSLGFQAIGSDRRKNAAPHYVRGGVDFLSARYELPVAPGACALIFNPPFLTLRAFIEKAVALRVDTVAALVPVHRLAAMSWLEDLPLTETLYLNPRPSMWPGREYKRRLRRGEDLGNGYQDFAWAVLHPGTSHRGFTGWLKRDGAKR